LNIDVNQGRARALKLADLSDHFRAERHPGRRGNLCDDLSRTLLVRRIAKTVEITNRDSFDALIAQFRDQSRHEGFVQRLQHSPVGGDALRDIEAQMAWH
jgi:hypothetical protein